MRAERELGNKASYLKICVLHEGARILGQIAQFLQQLEIRDKNTELYFK